MWAKIVLRISNRLNVFSMCQKSLKHCSKRLISKPTVINYKLLYLALLLFALRACYQKLLQNWSMSIRENLRRQNKCRPNDFGKVRLRNLCYDLTVWIVLASNLSIHLHILMAVRLASLTIHIKQGLFMLLQDCCGTTTCLLVKVLLLSVTGENAVKVLGVLFELNIKP